jgi:hypothetical protein
MEPSHPTEPVSSYGVCLPLLLDRGYTFKYTEGNNVSVRVARIDLVIDIYWRVGLQKAYRVVRGCHLGWTIAQFGATSNQKALAFV